MAEKLRESFKNILETSSHLRTPENQKVVQDYVAHIEFFRKILQEKGSEKLAELCNNLNYCYLEPEEVLFEQGSTGTTFYIVLEGKVQVLIKKKDENEPTKVSEITTGKTFGELALLEKRNSVRKATIKAAENPCHLASLEIDAYQKILGHITQELDEQIDFLETVPFFKFLNLRSGRYLQQFVKSFTPEVFSMGSVIYKEGDPCEDIYLVKSGELRNTKSVQLKNPKTNFLIDEHHKLYPYDSALITKQLELGTIVPGQFFGDEEALMLQLMRLKEETKNHNYMKNKGPSNDREQFIFEVNNLIAQSLVEKDASPVQKPVKGMMYRRNSLSKTEVIRDSTVRVKSLKAELWKISARFFFMYLDTNVAAYQYLFAKLEQNKRRREERLPSIARNTPTISTNRGGLKHILPADESYLSVIKQKKFAKEQYETLQVQSEIEKSVDVSYAESSPVKYNSVDGGPPSPKKAPLDLTITAEGTTPNVGGSKEQNIINVENGNNAPKSLLLHKLKPFQEPVRKKTEPVLLIQGFPSHLPSTPRKKDNQEDGRIARVTTKRGSAPAHDFDALNESFSSTQNVFQPSRPVSSTKHSQRQLLQRGRSTTPNRTKSLYDNDSPHRLFTKDDEKKSKKVRNALTPMRPRPNLSPSPSKTPFQQMINMRSLPVELKEHQTFNIHISLKERVKRTYTAEIPGRKDKPVIAPRVMDRSSRGESKPILRGFGKKGSTELGELRVTGFTKAPDTMQSFFGTEADSLNNTITHKMHPNTRPLYY